jgi:hypothetical protein
MKRASHQPATSSKETAPASVNTCGIVAAIPSPHGALPAEEHQQQHQISLLAAGLLTRPIEQEIALLAQTCRGSGRAKQNATAFQRQQQL